LQRDALGQPVHTRVVFQGTRFGDEVTASAFEQGKCRVRHE
jgi:hypothetical protein